MRSGRVAEWQSGKVVQRVACLQLWAGMTGACVVMGGCVIAMEPSHCPLPSTLDPSVRLFANPKLAPSIVPISREDNREWSGTLKVTMEGYPANGWPVVEVAPPGAGTMTLISITTQADWTSTPMMSDDRIRELEPFGEPVITRYSYRFVPGPLAPTSLCVRWKDRAEAEAEWQEEDQLKPTKTEGGK